ncbi:MAG: hypothetical protein HLUCCA12_06210 [Rhodobacteraceae bacterium HLUCCA12]|nr:MAG: hypothetical protein HLUCCA12_06210 [Rhodobacteraceae bacterium HLUCCA12]
MLEHLPEDIRHGLETARLRAQRRSTRLCVHVDGAVFPILRLWDTGFAVEIARAPQLRGLVDIYDGPRHLIECLIMASDSESGEMHYEFKRATVVSDTPVRDYADDRTPPFAYLPGRA